MAIKIGHAVGLQFPSGDYLYYKGTRIPHVFFSVRTALEEAAKWHPGVQFKPFRLIMLKGNYK